MRHIFVIATVLTAISATFSCGSPESGLCHKLERCDLLGKNGYSDVDDIEECLDVLEDAKEGLKRQCTNSTEVLKAYDKLMACGAKLSCEELEDENSNDMCEKESREYRDAWYNCLSGGDDDAT